MAPDNDYCDVKGVLESIPVLITDKNLFEDLLEDANSDDVKKSLARYKFPDDDQARRFLLIILQQFNQSQTRIEVPPDPGVSSFDQHYVEQFRDIHMESFYNIQWTYHVSLGMSVTMFIVGLVLMVIAVASAYQDTEFSMSTLTIAGLSIADFVFLFYTKPWQDVAKGLSNAQQVKLIINSYLAGVALIRREPDDQNRPKMLMRLTHHSVYLLETYAEPGS